jgi:hypothetical protein
MMARRKVAKELGDGEGVWPLEDLLDWLLQIPSEEQPNWLSKAVKYFKGNTSLILNYIKENPDYLRELRSWETWVKGNGPI